MDTERLDLRKLPVWERPAKVFDVFDNLPPGGSLMIVTDNEPRGLATQIEQARKHQLMFDPCRISDNEWVIHIKRSNGEPEASSPLGVLKRTPAFAGVQPEVIERLAAESSLHSARRGQAIVVEGTDWPYLGIVFEGVLALGSGNGHTRPRIFLEAFPYEVFGEVEFFDGAPANARISVLSKAARYLRVSRRAILDGGQPDSALLLALGRVCAQRSREMMQTLATQGTMPIIARIAQALLPFAPPEQGLAPAIAPLSNMTQSQIAATAGTVKEVAARAIAELELRGLLKRERGHIRFLDRQKLLDLIREEE
jgi:CRP/FNR family transcriptional regulator, cyclic AMP receptor protein